MIGSLIFYLVFIISLSFFSASVEKESIKRSAIRIKKWKNDIVLYPQFILCMGLIILIPTLVAALRENVGQDFVNYKSLFELSINTSTFDYRRFGGYNTEVIIYCLYKLGYFLFHDFHGFLFVAALLSYGIMFLSLKKHYTDASFPMMIYVYLMCLMAPSFNIIKQILAVSIVTFGFKYIEERKFIKYFITVAIAMLCHTSAIFSVGFYFFYSPKRFENKIRQFIIVIVAMAAPFLFSTAFSWMGNFSIFAKYMQLYSSDFVANVNINSIILHLPIAIMVILNFRKLLEENDRNSLYLCIYIFKFVALVLSFYTNYSFRLMYYCIPAEIILVGKIVKNNQGKQKFVFTVYSCAFYLMYFIYSFYISELDAIFPYTSILG